MSSDYLDGSDWQDYDEYLSKRNEWAQMHGYVSYTCPQHGKFWSDSDDGCPLCIDSKEEEA